jgi:hypothetical protein
MKIEVGKRYKLRNGLVGRCVCVDAKGMYPVICLVPTNTGNDEPCGFMASGQFDSDSEGGYDIISEYTPGYREVKWPEDWGKVVYVGDTDKEFAESPLTTRLVGYDPQSNFPYITPGMSYRHAQVKE